VDEFAQIFAQYQDHLAPKLDMYEQAIHLYILRHTVVESKREEVIGFKSARKKLAFGTGKAGTPPSEGVIYEKLRGLAAKGCVEILGSEREEWHCFYCLAQLDENNHVIEHVVSRPEGDNSFRNTVAACRQCNNRKSDSAAADFLRVLYREGILSGDEFPIRISLLERLQRGELPPSLP
jgi:hypothetical protein